MAHYNKKRDRVMFSNLSSISDDDKYSFITALLSEQMSNDARGGGFALRHVNSDEILASNRREPFRGDAVSYCVSSHIMSCVLGETVSSCFWLVIKDIYVYTVNNGKYKDLDTALAVKIFDILHDKMLQFMSDNFCDKTPHHFMLIQGMQRADNPYDFDSYPTGKCGKRDVKPKQILEHFSKSESLATAERLLNAIENRIIALFKRYTPQDYKAILSVLREVKGNASLPLTRQSVRRQLTEAEYDNRWSDKRYQKFYGTNGYFQRFEKLIPQVNEDLPLLKKFIP